MNTPRSRPTAGPSAAPLSLTATARKYGYPRRAIRKAIDAGLIRSVGRSGNDTATRITIDEAEFLDDIANLPTCGTPGCSTRVTGSGRYCTAHQGDDRRIARARSLGRAAQEGLLAASMSLTAIAEKYAYDRHALKAAVDANSIRCNERNVRGIHTRILINEAEFLEDLSKLPACKHQNCSSVAISPTGYCPEHGDHAARDATAAKRDDVRASGRSYYLATEAARVTGESLATLYVAINNGELPSEKVSGERRIPKQAIAERRKKRGPAHHRPTKGETLARRARTAELFGQGLGIGEIAKKLSCAPTTVSHDLDVSGIERPRRGQRSHRLSPEHRRARIAEAARLYSNGHTMRTIASIQGSSRTQVRRDLATLGIEPRPAHRPAKYPPVSERRCARCGAAFTPPSPAFGDQRYCTALCARRARSDAYRAELIARNLLSPSETARLMDLSVPRVHEWLASRLLIGERFEYDGGTRRGWGIAEHEIVRFERDWARGSRGSTRSAGVRRRWLNPDRAVNQLDRQGVVDALANRMELPKADIAAMERARVARRQARLARHRRGRPAGPANPDAIVWQAMHSELRAELIANAEHASDRDQPAERPSHRAVCEVMALDDWKRSPDSWPRHRWHPDPTDPETLDPALVNEVGDRIRQALKRVKRLQITRTEIPPA